MSETASEVGGRLDTHEQVCAERYRNLIQRMSRVENVMWAVAGVICLSFLGLITALLLDRINFHPLPSEPPSIAEPHRFSK